MLTATTEKLAVLDGQLSLSGLSSFLCFLMLILGASLKPPGKCLMPDDKVHTNIYSRPGYYKAF